MTRRGERLSFTTGDLLPFVTAGFVTLIIYAALGPLHPGWINAGVRAGGALTLGCLTTAGVLAFFGERGTTLFWIYLALAGAFAIFSVVMLL